MTIPAIIHNSNYFLIQMAVYENGTVSCWHKSDLQQFRTDLQKGWVVPQAPVGEGLSITNLGIFPIREARWRYDAERFYAHVEDVVRSLNPEMTNLYRTTQREQEKWDKARAQWSASPTPCKLKPGFGYNLLDGKSGYIFYWKESGLHLTPLTGYADKSVQLRVTGEQTYSMEEIDALFERGALTTTPSGEAWVQIDGLGEVLLGQASYGEVPAEEKRKEIADTLADLSGEQDSQERCRELHYQYLTDPNDWTREALRKAYEAVPEHQRMYLGDMDTRDSDFIRILYYHDEKREV